MNYKSGTVSSSKYCFQIGKKKKDVNSSFVLNNAIQYIFYKYIYIYIYTTHYNIFCIYYIIILLYF